MIIIDKTRKEFIARIVADLGKTIFAIGLASYFFEKFPTFLRIALYIGCIAFLGGSVFIQPKDKGDDRTC